MHLLEDPKLFKAVETFPKRLREAINMLASDITSNDYPILHPDFLIHNILLDDDYEIVGVIDWEYAHTVPLEVFAARMNMYASFNPQLAAQDFDEEGKQYIKDLSVAEMGMVSSSRLCGAFSSIFGDLGLCMRF